MDSVKRSRLAPVQVIKSFPAILRKAYTMVKVRLTWQSVVWMVQSLLTASAKPPITLTVRIGWCMRSGWETPGDCIFFDVVNESERPVTIEKLGIRLEKGKDIVVEPRLFHPPLPFDMEGRMRRVFSITAAELVEQLREHWITLDIVSAFVMDSNTTLYQGKVPRHVRDKLHTEYFAR